MGGGSWKPVPAAGGGAGGDPGAKLYIQAGSKMNDMPYGEDDEAPF
jgi:replicative DNA helicase